MSVAGKHLDPVLGIDVHIVQPPGPVPPVPIPHPFIGLVLDPFDYAPWIGATVMVNGLPRCQASTGGYALPPHIPIGGMFIKPPGNELEVFMGSSTVTVEGEPFTYLGLPALTCSDIGMPPPPHPGKKSVPKSMFLPTSVVLCVPMGAPVLVGGTPTISLTALAFKAALAGLGKLRQFASRSERMRALASRMHRRAAHIMDRLGIPPSLRNRVHRGICAVTGHPIDVATGKLFTEALDLELPGPIPLRWGRVWFSTSVYRGPLGCGWHHEYDLALLEDRDVVAIRLADGRGLAAPALAIGGAYFDRKERVTLIRDIHGYALRSRDHLLHRFAPSPSGAPTQLLSAIEDVHGNRVVFCYDQRDCLCKIIDSGGRELSVVHDAAGQLVELRGPDPERAGSELSLLRYVYDRYNRLVEVHDSLGPCWRYEWAGSLMIQETSPAGLDFFFEWDRRSPDARCVRSWGTGKLLERKLRYLEGETRVLDSHGAMTRYTVANGLAVSVEDPDGGVWEREYGEFAELLAHQDPLGNRREYDYDERGNLCEIREPDGSVARFAWSEDDLLQRSVDANGGWWQWRHDERGRVRERLDPAGGSRHFIYQGRWLTGTVDGDGAFTSFGWDAQGNVTGIRSPSGATEQWQYDVLGRPTRHVDARGQVQRRRYDPRGRLVGVEDGDGRISEARWDGHDNLIWARVGEFEASFEYTGRGKLCSRRVGDERLRFIYDSEERLRAVIDQAGQRYEFEHDTSGNLIAETDFGGATRRYQRDAAGRIVARTSAGGVETRYVNDPNDRLVEAHYADGTQARYRYRGDGLLCAASNDAIELELERDGLGRILVERQGEHWIASRYDGAGRRVELRSSLGGHQQLHYDDRGMLTRLEHHDHRADDADDATPWICEFERDLLGVELERRMPGGVLSSWTLDRAGRATQHRISVAGQGLRTRSYGWKLGLQLGSIDDDLSGVESFGHDALGAMSWAKRDGEFELQLRDLTRKVFASQDTGSREYGPCGELRRDMDVARRYDADGQLIEKRDADGGVWRYEWSAAGQLARVLRPDGRRVEFVYDALGRRVAKRFDGVVTRWLWDGSVPLHEWQEAALDDEPLAPQSIDERPLWRELLLGDHSARGPPDPLTWVFEPRSFKPLARLGQGSRLAIVCDHRWAPLCAVDDQGEVAWQADLDLTGTLRLGVGARETVPFRFAGQYEDPETGLYYNRFRYYDPEAGAYISRDPGGILHGLSVYAYVNDPHRLIDPFGLNPTDIALGLANAPVTIELPGMPPISTVKEDALGQFAANPVGDSSVRATAWPGFDGVSGTPVDQLGPRIRDAMDDATTIHFNLEGMNNVDAIAANPNPSLFHPPSTNWELSTVLSDPDLRAKTHWYDGPGNRVPCPG